MAEEPNQTQSVLSLDAQYGGIMSARNVDVTILWTLVGISAILHSGLFSFFYLRLESKLLLDTLPLIASVGFLLAATLIIFTEGLLQHIRTWNARLSIIETTVPENRRVFTAEESYAGVVRGMIKFIVYSIAVVWIGSLVYSWLLYQQFS